MFGHRFYGARFYGPRYWGDGGSAAPAVSTAVPPVSAGGLAGKRRTYRYIGAPVYEPERKIVRVLIEEEKRGGGVEYKAHEWKPEASWQALLAAIEAINTELGNFDGSLERSILLRKELRRLKKKRNQRIILMAIE